MGVRPKIPLLGAALAVMASALLGGASRPAGAAARSRESATTAQSARELDDAIGLFERFNPHLLEPNAQATVGGHRIKPAFTPLRFHREGSIGGYFSTHLVGNLVGGEIEELQMAFGEYGPVVSLPANSETSLADADDTERLINATALVEGHIKRQTDVLVRPSPLGFSVYLQFRSRSAPERITFSTKVQCAIGSEGTRRVGAGTFVIEGLHSEDEGGCRPYSRARLPAQAPPGPSDTAANYQYEMRLLKAARHVAQEDNASIIAVLSATSARDATGRIVPTDFAWRPEYDPVLRVHLKNGNYRYPIVARVDFIGVPD
jgi:hypothetical protein